MTHPIPRLLLVMSALMAPALIAGIVWALLDSNVIEGLRFLSSDRWGVVTLIDVYAGVIVVAAWIWQGERRVTTWLYWVTAMLCLGHLVSLIYLLIQFSKGCKLTEFNGSAPHLIERERTSP